MRVCFDPGVPIQKLGEKSSATSMELRNQKKALEGHLTTMSTLILSWQRAGTMILVRKNIFKAESI